eukprot:m51a1_g5129 hypothetical protein (92) ;mRNA; f:403773-404048
MALSPLSVWRPIKLLFVLSLIWSARAMASQKARTEFDERQRLLAHENESEHELPPEGLVYDNRYGMGEKKREQHQQAAEPATSRAQAASSR